MKFSSLFAPKRIFALALPMLATFFVFGLSGISAARATDPGYITAKTWIDPANGHAAYGDWAHDDWQNLQDMINYAIAHTEAIQFEPGSYRITKTLVIQTVGYNEGFRMTGIAGPNWAPGQPGGISIVLDAVTTQPAVLEVGQGGFYDMSVENLALVSNPGSVQASYGLLFAWQQFSHAYIHNVAVQGADTSFAVVQGTTSGANGEALELNNCDGGGGRCFYFNNCGQAFYHRIINCQGGAVNGGVFLRIGNSNGGHDLDVSSISCTFASGPLRNTFLEVNGVSGTVNVKGGRVESCDTILSYSGGSPGFGGIVTVEGIDFDGCPGHFPILDASHYGLLSFVGDAQYTNTILRCKIGAYGGKPLTLEPTGSEDLSRSYFEKCVFTGWSNKITAASNQPALNAMQVRVRDCRSDIPTDVLMSDLRDYTPAPPARGGY